MFRGVSALILINDICYIVEDLPVFATCYSWAIASYCGVFPAPVILGELGKQTERWPGKHSFSERAELWVLAVHLTPTGWPPGAHLPRTLILSSTLSSCLSRSIYNPSPTVFTLHIALWVINEHEIRESSVFSFWLRNPHFVNSGLVSNAAF